MTLFSKFLTTTWRVKTQLYLFNELQLHTLFSRASYFKIGLNGVLLKGDRHWPSLFFSSNITHLNRPAVENSPTLQHGNLIVKISSKINNLSAILAVLNEIFKLKYEKATAIVVENKLRALTFHYHNLQNEEKDEFFKTLATKHAVDHSSIMKLSKQLADIDPESSIMLKTEEKLKDALTPQFYWLFVHLGRLDDGVKFLVDLRSDLMSLLSSSDVKSPHHISLQQLNSVLRGLLNLWFSVGFLHLERVTWSSPCCLLQKISEYEAVHPVRSWTDIRQRVGPYRRCFVYTHHNMPGEPLVVLHVALTQEISDSMKSIISRFSRIGDEKPYQSNIVEDKNNIKAFIFYSISSTQKGLQGIDLGNYLIKRAAKELHAEYPQATQFSSLSPIPSFRQWLLDKIKLAEKGESVLPAKEWDEVVKLVNPEDEADAWAKLRSMITDNSWIHNENLVSALKSPLMVSCGQYLYIEKRRGYAFDSVANFHLRNGAVMWRLNWLADPSPRGLSQSCGLMVNYRYYLDAADKNSQQYIKDRTIPASEQIINLSVNSKI